MPDSAFNQEIDLKNRANPGVLRIAGCQFGFEFESRSVSRTEYEEFLQLPPGEMSYFIYKEKLLCNHLTTETDFKTPRTKARYGSQVGKKGIFFTVGKKYRKKKFKDNDTIYRISDYDCIISRDGEEYCKNMMLELPANYGKDKARALYAQYKDQEEGVMKDIGCFEKIPGAAGDDKIGINFFEYLIIKDTEKDALSVFSPGECELINICSKNYDVIKEETNNQDPALDDTYGTLFTRILFTLGNKRITRALRIFFKSGIMQNAKYPLYLADDAQIIVLGEGKWGIINYAYAGYYKITDNNDLVLFDNAKFELKTYKNYWPLEIDKQLWKDDLRRFLAKKFIECHYPLTNYFKDPGIDDRTWQVYTADEQVDAPEFHVIFLDKEDKTPDIYITQYIRVSIKNPGEVIKKIEQNLLLAFENQVNVLCLPELALFLPRDLLENMLESVYHKCIERNKVNISSRKFLFSDILIFSSTYLKRHKNTHRIINLGVGVDIAFDNTGLIVDRIKMIPFQKHIYSPAEYSKNNVEPGFYAKPGKELFRWFDSHYWDISKDVPDEGDKDSVKPIRTKAGIDIYPFICSDFVASKIYKYKELFEHYQLSAVRGRAQKRQNIIIIPAYSQSVNIFLNNLAKITESTKMVVFANNTEITNEYYEFEETCLNENFGGSFIFCTGMKKDGKEIDLFHFDRIRSTVCKEKRMQCNSAPNTGAEMIIATLYYKENTCPCTIELAGKSPVSIQPLLSILIGDKI